MRKVKRKEKKRKRRRVRRALLLQTMGLKTSPVRKFCRGFFGRSQGKRERHQVEKAL